MSKTITNNKADIGWWALVAFSLDGGIIFCLLGILLFGIVARFIEDNENFFLAITFGCLMIVGGIVYGVMGRAWPRISLSQRLFTRSARK